MINCFYWYSIIWSSVFILYNLGFSSYNTPLHPMLSSFIIISAVASAIIGKILNKKIKIEGDCYKKVSNRLFIFLIILLIADFIYCRQIPLLSILIFKNSAYGDFLGIPVLHPALIGVCVFLSIRLSLNFIYGEKGKRKKDLMFLLILSFFFLLFYYRSMIIFQLFAFSNIWLYKYRINNKLNFKKIVVGVLLALIALFIYGGVGNIRDGYSFNDNSYIERLGGYSYFPSFVPKQYMWTYSYITSPLANLNYNVVNNNTHKNKSIAYELAPDFIYKRLFKDEVSHLMLIKKYFSASTGWSHAYINGGFPAIVLCFLYMIILTSVGLLIKPNTKKGISHAKMAYCVMSCIVTSFMFFYNTLTYIGLFTPFVISLFYVFYESVLAREEESDVS